IPLPAPGAGRAGARRLGARRAERRQRGRGRRVPRASHRLHEDRRADRARARLGAAHRAQGRRRLRRHRRRDSAPRPRAHRRHRGGDPVTTALSFIVVIGILILIHEWGHFIVARWAGVGVERFSIGFGPVLLRWRGKETEYCLSVIPMGGYVKMMGEENPLEGGAAMPYDPSKAFALKPLWKRFLIVFAGPGMNFVLAAVIFMGVLGTVGRPVWPPVVGRVDPGGPAASTGLATGDT